ncbi:MAG: hypothetical protein GC161_14765 [Planctomycetaceae bacterium]|nr:hypothetical protein [Planctomycetaceae bacterium]
MSHLPITYGLGLVLCTAASALGNGTSDDKPAPIQASAPTVQAPVSATDMRTFWSSGLRFETADKQIQYAIGGRIHADGTWIHADDEVDTGNATSTDDRVGFRRSRLMVEGTFYETIAFRTQYDFAGANANFRDVYLQFRKLFWGTTLWVGQYREPFSLDQLNSSNDNAFLERSLVDIFAPGRTTGISVSGNGQGGKINYHAGVFHANSNANTGNGVGDGSYAATGRFTYAPMLNDKGTEVLHFGVAASRRSVDGYTRNVTRPEFDSNGNWISADFANADCVLLMGGEAAFIQGPLALQGEFVQAEIDNDGSADRSAHGYYVQATYGLTGEGRTYKGALIQRPKPTDPYKGPGTGGGAWELAARYSFLDLNDGSVASTDTENITVGVNWYANPQVAVRLNYVMADFDEYDGGANAIGVRFQFVF